MPESPKKLIVGLGNVGEKYKNTRHNVGFIFLDALDMGNFATRPKLFGQIAVVDTMVLLKPTTFMNLSGKSVAATMKYFDISLSNVIVVHDDTDLPVGSFKVQKGRGAAGHKGVLDIINVLGTKDFLRVRVGIGHSDQISLEKFVLQRLLENEVAFVCSLAHQLKPTLLG